RGAHVAMSLACLGFGQADVGYLGFGEGRPRYDTMIGLAALAQRVGTCDAPLIRRGMGEGKNPGDIAGGVDTCGGGPHVAVDDHPGALDSHAGLLEAERFGVGTSPGGDEERVATQSL